MRITKETEQTLQNLRAQGIKFNIANRVEHRIELHQYYTNLDGSQHGHFVAELDDYGNITEWGPFLQDDRPISALSYDAEGNPVLGGPER